MAVLRTSKITRWHRVLCAVFGHVPLVDMVEFDSEYNVPYVRLRCGRCMLTSGPVYRGGWIDR
jgi:hypothetical protein